MLSPLDPLWECVCDGIYSMWVKLTPHIFIYEVSWGLVSEDCPQAYF